MKRMMIVFVIGFSMPLFLRAQTDQNLTFGEAVKIALEKNVTLNQQKNQLEANQAARMGAIANHLPNLNAQGSFQRQQGQQPNTTNGNLEDLITDYTGLYLNTNYTIFSGMGRLNTYSQTNHQLTAQGYLIKRSTQDVIFNVANQYLQVLLDQELLAIAKENLASQVALLEQIQATYEVGSKAITDVYNQDALVKAAEVTAIRARNTMQNDKALLAQILQLEPQDTFTVVSPENRAFSAYVKLSVDSLTQLAISNRADLHQSQELVKANKYSLKSAGSTYSPNLSVYANYGSFYYSLITNSYKDQFLNVNRSLTYGATLNIPIFSRYQTKTQRVTARVAYENSMLTKENLEKTVKIDVIRAMNNFHNAQEAYQSSLAQFKAGELSLQTQEESYSLGISSFVELADARRTYVQGAGSKAQAEVTLIFQRVLLEYALGTLSIEDLSAQ
ncbi:MAG TPA: TolC family protein [Chryseolinea sp.]|nr:TolC family protein [Chryseolinea sp.]